jgi:predicted MFS family arabinose efflux permease
MTRPWPTIIALWLLGVLAAAQLAKISIIAPLLQSRFGLSLPQTGLLISLLEVGGAMLGFVAGLALGRIGLRRCLLTGLILLTVSGLVEAMAPDIGALFVARALEGWPICWSSLPRPRRLPWWPVTGNAARRWPCGAVSLPSVSRWVER